MFPCDQCMTIGGIPLFSPKYAFENEAHSNVKLIQTTYSGLYGYRGYMHRAH